MQQKPFKNREEWRTWLERNHASEKGIWLVFYKVKAKKESIKYEEAVEEALCFGWIDSVVRRIDDERHMQKYTPRRVRGNWSATNKARVEKLVKEGLMTKFGLEVIKIAKQNGSWERFDSIDIRLGAPKEFRDALERHDSAKRRFENLPPSGKRQFLWWIDSAKRNETKEKRIKETIRLLLENKRLGER